MENRERWGKYGGKGTGRFGDEKGKGKGGKFMQFPGERYGKEGKIVDEHGGYWGKDNKGNPFYFKGGKDGFGKDGKDGKGGDGKFGNKGKGLNDFVLPPADPTMDQFDVEKYKKANEAIERDSKRDDPDAKFRDKIDQRLKERERLLNRTARSRSRSAKRRAEMEKNLEIDTRTPLTDKLDEYLLGGGKSSNKEVDHYGEEIDYRDGRATEHWTDRKYEIEKGGETVRSVRAQATDSWTRSGDAHETRNSGHFRGLCGDQ